MTRGPLIQLALDTEDLAGAVRVAARSGVDVVEAGTVLLLHRGLDAVRALRAAVPGAPLVADVRIARAGEMFAGMVFDAGADRVTVVGEAGRAVVAGAARAAARAGGEVEVELWPTWTEEALAALLVDEVRRVIVHRPGGVTAADDETTRGALDRLAAMDLGDREVTLAGGIGPGDLRHFAGRPFDVVAVGKAIAQAADPARVTEALRRELDDLEVWHGAPL
ncbi:orotidine 5'-phosphate decarboxylase / HUMPS family protein [Actinophytocola sp. NPDC049390]|uniref:orotidine 5'-phosphate decarboxylase / HUMPS family protein n=1 Tax=Actinophytocola sp. NPDC049390 TaxID=3363894 RepID=UPI00379D5C25